MWLNQHCLYRKHPEVAEFNFQKTKNVTQPHIVSMGVGPGLGWGKGRSLAAPPAAP